MESVSYKFGHISYIFPPLCAGIPQSNNLESGDSKVAVGYE